jgi:hypothetical protein
VLCTWGGGGGARSRLHHSNTRVRERLFPILLLESVVNFSESLVNFSGRDVLFNEEFDHNALFHAPRYLLFAHHSSWTGSNPNRREGGGCGFTHSRSHSCCAVRLVYTQIRAGHIWTTLYNIDMWLYPIYICDLQIQKILEIFFVHKGITIPQLIPPYMSMLTVQPLYNITIHFR